MPNDYLGTGINSIQSSISPEPELTIPIKTLPFNRRGTTFVSNTPITHTHNLKSPESEKERNSARRNSELPTSSSKFKGNQGEDFSEILK